MAGISDKAVKTNYSENKYRYNKGSELQNKEFSDGSGLEMYTTNYRMLDPQLGVFHQIDPFAEVNESASPYAYANDNPILYNDPLGLLSDSSHPQELKPVTVTPQKKNSSSSGILTAALPPLRTRMVTDHPVPRPNFNPTLRYISAEEANQGFKEPPYAKGTRVAEYRTMFRQKFVRVFNPGNSDSKAAGRWMMKEGDMQGLRPDQIKERFAVPGENPPTEMVEVEVPQGTLMRAGYAGTNAFGTGGGVQYQLLENIPESSFLNPTTLPTTTRPLIPESGIIPETGTFEEPPPFELDEIP